MKDAPILERAKQHHIPAHYIDCTPSLYALRDQAEATVPPVTRTLSSRLYYSGWLHADRKESLLNAFQKSHQHSPLSPARFSRSRGRTAGV